MAANVAKNWQMDFGLEDRKPPHFFSDKNDLTPSAPQAHVVRRAFDLLDLDGVLCQENAPLVYFKQVDEIILNDVVRLHRQFWNHGGAPILVLISKDKIHIYSGMSRPVPTEEISNDLPSLVKTLDRVSELLHEFIISVETGEFFHKNVRSFNPGQRVDRDLLNNLNDTRDALEKITKRNIGTHILDALLCRLVFTCYLFDRGVIGEAYLKKVKIKNATHLREVLSHPSGEAKIELYRLFQALGRDFNGDLFSDNLDTEANKITDKHINVVNEFFHGTQVKSGQRSFWAYDFEAIPIETISAIYEHFLKTADHQSGAFYTPRFLAEVVLDTALEGFGSLLGKRFLDPACGSGIFLVGLFNRIAEEWKQNNPTARNDRRARELRQILQRSLFGSDINPTACRITAFSLYLAYLDQLTPRDIQELQERGAALPRLVFLPGQSDNQNSNSDRGNNIRCGDFFADPNIQTDIDLVIGNPPWESIAADDTPAGQWCINNGKLLRDKQIAAAFIWKAATHAGVNGRVCFVLPYGIIFNHSSTAIAFQKEWVAQYKIERVLNLTDFSRFLFMKAGHPAIVVRYKNQKPNDHDQIEYLSPKVDWAGINAEIINISSSDQKTFSVREILDDLTQPDAPQIWKQNFWASSRDLALLERLSLYPRLRDHVRGSREKNEDKPWVMAEGFQPVGINDDSDTAKTLRLPSRKFIQAASRDINLFLLPDDCETLKSSSILVRNKSNKNTVIFQAPHVLIAKGFQSIAYCDFDVSFRHALRGIHGPKEHREILIFLAAYLRTPLAKYFMFHTSSSWGTYRAEGHVEEVLRLPFPFPTQQPNKKRCEEIVGKVAKLVDSASEQVKNSFIARESIIQQVTAEIEQLVYEYFEIHSFEKILILDTLNVIIPSIKPSQNKMPVPTLRSVSVEQQEAYLKRVCDILNTWSRNSQYFVRGRVVPSNGFDIGMVVLEKTQKSDRQPTMPTDISLLKSLDKIRKATTKKSVVNLLRGLMFFEGNRLYVVKSTKQRNWTQTAALNDADEIAGSILMYYNKDKA